jgi:PKD repeat protein
MKRLFDISSLSLLLVAGLFVQCSKDNKPAPPVVEDPKPTAAFTYKLTDSSSFLSYQFNSTSTNYKQLLWQFGDDSSSASESPLHVYKFPGEYHVILNTTNTQGYWATKEILLKLVDPNFDPTKVGENYIKTIGGVLSVSRDNGGGPNSGEGSLKVIDENAETKFFQSGFSGDLWIKFELDSAVVAGAYTMTSGNDSWDRDPKTWTLQGSEDDIKWITLHSVNRVQWNTNERKKRILYFFDNYVAYKFYRVNIKANNGSRDFQLCDWTVNKKQP